jgi:hypothetical protein
MADRAGWKSGRNRIRTACDPFYFLLGELARALTDEHPIIIVRHELSPFGLAFSQFAQAQAKAMGNASPLRELAVHVGIRAVHRVGPGQAGAGEWAVASVDLLQFVRCKLTGASAGEHPVLLVVRHRFLLLVFKSFSRTGENPLSKRNMD